MVVVGEGQMLGVGRVEAEAEGEDDTLQGRMPITRVKVVMMLLHTRPSMLRLAISMVRSAAAMACRMMLLRSSTSKMRRRSRKILMMSGIISLLEVVPICLRET